MPLLHSLCALMLLSGAVAAQATALADNLQVHGFLSQAAFYTSDNNLHGESDDGISTDMNEAGINAALQPWSNVRLAGQITARNDGNSDNGELRIDYLNADWQFLARQSWRLGARVGRVRNMYGLYNDTRDVAHTRPGVSIPMVAYLDQVRDVFMARDGYAMYGDIYTDYGAFSFDAGRGDLDVDDNIVSEALLTRVDAKAVDPAADQFQLRWESPSGDWRLAYSYLRLTSDFDVFGGGTFAFNLNVLSAQYTTERWQLTTEYVRFNYDVDFLITATFPGEVYQLQYSYFVTRDWQLYARYEDGVFDRDSRNGKSLETVNFPRHFGFRRQSTAGVRWDINEHWMVAAEAHYIEGVLAISILDNEPLETEPYWNALGFEVGFRF